MLSRSIRELKLIRRDNEQFGRITSINYKSGNNIFVSVSTFAKSNYRDIPLIQDYGIASIPKVNTRCVLIALNGDAESLICIATGSSKIDAGGLSEEEVLISSDKGGSIKVNKKINISGDTDISGNTDIDGNLDASGNLKAGGKADVKGELTVEDDTNIKGLLTVMTAAVTTLMVGAFAGPPPAGDESGNPGPFTLTASQLNMVASSLNITANGVNLIDAVVKIVDYIQNPPNTQQLRTAALNGIRNNLNKMKGGS